VSWDKDDNWSIRHASPCGATSTTGDGRTGAGCFGGFLDEHAAGGPVSAHQNWRRALQKVGKPKMVIRIALARKLLVRLNAKARDARIEYANAT
jgi:hypothetical protein